MEYLKNSYIRQNGKIWPFGMISTFSNNVINDDIENDSLGLAFWSEELIEYGDDNHYAKIVDEKIEVFSKEKNELIKRIKKLEIVQDNYVVIVENTGYLKLIGTFGDKAVNLNKAFEIIAEEDLGPFSDSGPFYKVSKEFIGLELIAINVDYEHSKRLLVFTPDGKRVEYTIE